MSLIHFISYHESPLLIQVLINLELNLYKIVLLKMYLKAGTKSHFIWKL